MKNSKLIVTLVSLQQEEWSLFRKYLLMKCGKNSVAFQLFTFYQNRKNELETIGDLNSIRKKYFPQLSNKGFANLNSKLYLWLTEWLVINEVIMDPVEHDLILIKVLNSRGHYKLANQKAEELLSRLKTYSVLDMNMSKQLTALLHTQIYSDNPIKYENPGLLHQLVEAFMLNFNNQALIYLMELQNWSKLQNLDYDEFIKFLESKLEGLPENELTQSLQLLYGSLDTFDFDSITSLKNSLVANKFKKGSELNTLITMYLKKICVEKWEKGELQDSKIIADLCEYGLISGAFLHNGKIPVIRFYNMIGPLSSSQSIESVNDFIEKWLNHVNSNFLDDTRTFAMAQNLFYHEKYEKIMQMLNSIRDENFNEKTRAKALQALTIYIERKTYHEDPEDQLKTFSGYLSRNRKKISKNLHTACFHLIDDLKLLLKKEYKQVEEKMDNEDYLLLYRQWFLREIKKASS